MDRSEVQFKSVWFSLELEQRPGVKAGSSVSNVTCQVFSCESASFYFSTGRSFTFSPSTCACCSRDSHKLLPLASFFSLEQSKQLIFSPQSVCGYSTTQTVSCFKVDSSPLLSKAERYLPLTCVSYSRSTPPGSNCQQTNLCFNKERWLLPRLRWDKTHLLHNELRPLRTSSAHVKRTLPVNHMTSGMCKCWEEMW